MMMLRANRRNFLSAITIFFILSPCVIAARETEHSYIPSDGYVPDATTAIIIAEAVLVPIYGKEQIEKEKPLTATLSEGVWTVRGTLAEGMLGGVAEVDISKSNSEILRVTHGK